MNLETLVGMDLGGESEKSGVTGFLVGVLEMKWGAGWCGKDVDSAHGTSREGAEYASGEMPGLGQRWNPQLMLVLEAICSDEIILEGQQGMKNSSRGWHSGPRQCLRAGGRKSSPSTKNSGISTPTSSRL